MAGVGRAPGVRVSIPDHPQVNVDAGPHVICPTCDMGDAEPSTTAADHGVRIVSDLVERALPPDLDVRVYGMVVMGDPLHLLFVVGDGWAVQVDVRDVSRYNPDLVGQQP